MYPLVRELADDEFEVAVACRVLNVSRSGYYDWLGRPASPRQQDNELLTKIIEQVHKDSRGTYGSPRVHAELTMELGHEVNLKRVARLMREAGIQGLYRRRYRGCTVRDPAATPSADLVERNFTVTEPNRLWVTDITEHPTEEGKVYCAAVLDAFSRRILGWSIDDNMRTELVTDALGMAILRRCPCEKDPDNPTIMHSDHGSQFTSWAWGKRLRDAGLLPSMGSVGDSLLTGQSTRSYWSATRREVRLPAFERSELIHLCRGQRRRFAIAGTGRKLGFDRFGRCSVRSCR